MLQFKLRTLLVAAAVVALCIVVYKVQRENRLWRNTRFHCDQDAIVTLLRHSVPRQCMDDNGYRYTDGAIWNWCVAEWS